MAKKTYEELAQELRDVMLVNAELGGLNVDLQVQVGVLEEYIAENSEMEIRETIARVIPTYQEKDEQITALKEEVNRLRLQTEAQQKQIAFLEGFLRKYKQLRKEFDGGNYEPG